MSTRRGKKLNQVKNYVAAADFAAGKRIGRPKQVWVWDVEPVVLIPGRHPHVEGKGHWEKVNALK